MSIHATIVCVCIELVYYFSSPNTHPDKIAFNLQTGNVTAYNIHANYIPSDRGYAIVDRMAVPFRLTPNITNFLSIYYEGAFELAIGADALVSG